jgi:hypothetical protein
MTARMRWGLIGDSPVPWLAACVAVVLVTALAWLVADEPPALASNRPVEQQPGPATAVANDRDFSGVPALAALIIDAPAAPFEPIPDGQDGAGPRTLDAVAAQVEATGKSSGNAAGDLRASGYRGGVAKGWINRSDGSALFVVMDEFGGEQGALGWAGGLREGLRKTEGATEGAGPVERSAGVRIDVPTANGVQHQLLYLVWRGRRVALVQLATFGQLDAELVQGLARSQAARLDAAAS